MSNMYPGKGWKDRVKRMSDIQVTAIYLKNKGTATKPAPKKEKEEHDDIPF